MLMILCVICILAFVVIMSCVKAGKDYDNEMQEILDTHLSGADFDGDKVMGN